MTKIITVNQLVKRYRKAGVNAVDGISFYVESGSIFSLLGPNGAGKTTTISILTTLLQKTSGEVMIDGLEIDSQANEVRQKIGVIFQQPSLDINLTAEENVRLYANLYGVFPYRPSFGLMPKSYRDEVHHLATILGIEDELFKPIKTFSGGMKRKLEIIRSLLPKPSVIFLDEPTTGLDPEARQKLWKYLDEVRQERNITIFLTTHYLEEAEKSEYVCIINHGRIIARGTPAEIRQEMVDTYVLLDSKSAHRAQLVNEIKKAGFRMTKDTPPYHVDINSKHTAQAIISNLKTPLTTLLIHTPTLEEAYLSIINQPSEL